MHVVFFLFHQKPFYLVAKNKWTICSQATHEGCVCIIVVINLKAPMFVLKSNTDLYIIHNLWKSWKNWKSLLIAHPKTKACRIYDYSCSQYTDASLRSLIAVHLLTSLNPNKRSTGTDFRFLLQYNILNPVSESYVLYIQLENAFWVLRIVYDFTYVFKLIYSGRKKSQPEDEFILIFCYYIHVHF